MNLFDKIEKLDTEKEKYINSFLRKIKKYSYR